MNPQLNTACFRQFAVLLVLVSQFQTISSDWFANINADFILPSLHCPSASTEFASNPLIVKPLQHAIQSNRDQQKCSVPHCRLVYTGASYDLPHSIHNLMLFSIGFLLIFFNRKSHSSWNYRQCRSPKKWGEGGGWGAAAEPLEPYAHGKLSHSL